ncbi:MAG: phosphoribosylglycinamide formyltransferase [Gammaproteobacteria bacterium]
MLSGNGSNLQALAQYAQVTKAFDVAGVVSDRADAYGLQRAKQMGLPTACCPKLQLQSSESHEAAILEALKPWSPTLVVLAGYMRILGPELVRALHGQLVNVHPSLLPKYRGLNTYRRALAAGDTEHGASIHYVTEELDGGPVIAQGRVLITDSDTEQTLCAKVQAMEHQLYPLAVHALALGVVTLHGERVHWRGATLSKPLNFSALKEGIE